MKVCKKTYQANSNQNKQTDKWWISDINNKQCRLQSDYYREVYLIMIKGSNHQEAIVIINVNASKNLPSKFIKQNLLEMKGRIVKSTVIVRN